VVLTRGAEGSAWVVRGLGGSRSFTARRGLLTPGHYLAIFLYYLLFSGSACGFSRNETT